jgi:isoleucyl-tRNA synthetase
VLIPLWNVWYFFTLYANTAGEKGYEATPRTDSPDVLDRYVLAKTRDLVRTAGEQLDEYDLGGACTTVRDFIDGLSNWYVRRSRERFWAADGLTQDGRNAFDTLAAVLETLCRVAAPLAPMVTEEIWRGLTGGRSVHLTDWPDAAALPADDALVAAMDRIREVASAALGLRKANGLRVRLPLPRLTVVTADPAALEPFSAILADELNVKQVVLTGLDDEEAARIGVTERLTVNARAAGPRLGRNVQAVIKAAKAGDWSAAGGVVTCGGVELAEGEYTLETVVDEAEAGHLAVATLSGEGFVVLDTAVGPELAREGLARDLIRAVQQVRRDVGLAVGDRIRLSVGATGEAAEALAEHRALIAAETLAVEVADGPGGTEVSLGDGHTVTVGVERR